MIEEIRQYFIDYFDRMNPNGHLGVDYLGPNPVSYSVESGIGDPWITRYIDGGGVKQYNFLLTSREWFGSDAVTNAENLEFYDYLSKTIEENNDAGNVPAVPGAVQVEVLTNGYLMESESDNARYQIQLRLIYTT